MKMMSELQNKTKIRSQGNRKCLQIKGKVSNAAEKVIHHK